MTVRVLGGGAVRGLVEGIAEMLAASNATVIEGTFGPVGMMMERFVAGQPCDILILTDPLIGELINTGKLRPGSARAIGVVHAAIAVPAGHPRPNITSSAALQASLLAASALYVPDTKHSTAGRHLARTLRALGVADALVSRLREFESGEASMRALATEAVPGSLGCTQNTEIVGAPGLDLVGVLPPEHDLATTYTAAASATAADPALAELLVALLSGARSRALRQKSGFAEWMAAAEPKDVDR